MFEVVFWSPTTVEGLWVRVQGSVSFGPRVWDLNGLESRVKGSGARLGGPGSRFEKFRGLEFRVLGFGGFGFRGLGFRVMSCERRIGS